MKIENRPHISSIFFSSFHNYVLFTGAVWQTTQGVPYKGFGPDNIRNIRVQIFSFVVIASTLISPSLDLLFI